MNNMTMNGLAPLEVSPAPLETDRSKAIVAMPQAERSLTELARPKGLWGGLLLTGFTKRYSLGIDVSDTGVKILLLVKQGKNIAVAGFAEETFPKDAHCEGRITNTEACTSAMTKAWNTMRHLMPRSYVPTIASLSDTHIQMTLVTLPTNLVAEERILEEAKKNIPLHTETSITSWQTAEVKDDNTIILVMSVPRAISDELAGLLQAVHFFPSAIESESMALARLFGKSNQDIIIDIGESRTLFLVTKKDIPVSTLSLPLTGATLTENIAKTLQLPTAEAEETKIRCGFDDDACKGALKEIVRSYLDEALQRIAVALDEVPKEPSAPNTITLVGGGAHLKKVDVILTKELAAPVSLGTLWTTVERPNSFSAHELSFAVAMGLALRGLLE